MMRGSRLVTTERVVCFASPGSDDAVDQLDAAMDAHDATLTVKPVGEPLDPDDWIAGKTLGITVGGDGTFLAGVRAFAPRSIPFFGVNTGTLGFLARTDPADLAPALSEVFRGEASVSDRQRLRVVGPGVETTGINEVTFELPMPEDPVGRKVCQLEVAAGGEYLGRYEGTGLAVATPTGSTAMALSADGPLEHPANNRTLQIVGLHTNRLGFRPVVLDADHEVRVAADSPVRVSVDGGRPELEADAADTFTITGADEPAHLVWTSHDASFFAALAAKLDWGSRRDDPAPPRPAARRTGGQSAASHGTQARETRARDAAREAVCAAGETVNAAFRRIRRGEADPAAETAEAARSSGRILAATLGRAFPGVDVQSADGAIRAVDADGGDSREAPDSSEDLVWLAAPLDGVANFGRGNPYHAVSLALVDDGPVAGAVAAPAVDEVLAAGRDGGVTRGSIESDTDGTSVGTTDCATLDEATVLAEGTPAEDPVAALPGDPEIRRLGSPALALAYIAAGRADACLLADVHPATVAGGCSLLQAAGGRVTTADGESFRLQRVDTGPLSLIASNGPLHGALLAASDSS
jgi:myo-inositol-1(or 4)-monophosphatase